MASASAARTERAQAFTRVREWTRARFTLSSAATILVSEMACAQPGFPSLETHVLFLAPGGQRHHFRIFKPVTQIGEDDLPYAWLKDTLIVPEGAGCDCC